MMKSVCLLSRPRGGARVDFQAYYEDNHAPLGAKHFPFTKYVRNHLRGDEDVGFDTISEFWAHDIAATAALMDGPVGEILRADERRFMDQSAIRPAGAVEQLLAGTPRTLEDSARVKLAVLLRRGEDADAEEFRSAVESWGRSLGGGADRVTVDWLTAWTERGFPCEAILWVWPTDAEIPLDAPPAAVQVWRRLAVRACETPPSKLLGASAASDAG